MSDDDRDIDIESDDDIDSDFGTVPMSQRHNSSLNSTQAEKRAHHNALERKRRDHIKESFTNLREAVPTLKGEKASRAQILKKTTECILNLRRKIQANQKDVEDIEKQNAKLEAQIRALEKAKNGYPLDVVEFQQLAHSEQAFLQDDERSSDDDDDVDSNRRSKKMKTSYQA